MPRRLEKGKGLAKEGTTSSNKTRDFTRFAEEKKLEHTTLSIPENFKLIGGNSDLSDAKIVFIAEEHSYNHLKDNVALLEKWAKTDDILLVEGHHSMQPVTTKEWIKSECTTYRDDIRTLSKQLKVYGWDNLEVNRKVRQLYSLETKLRNELSDTLHSLDIDTLYRLNKHIKRLNTSIQDLRTERNNSLIATIDHTLTHFQPEGKIFIIAGEMHYNQSQEVQEALAKYSYITLQTTRVMPEEEINQYQASIS